MFKKLFWIIFLCVFVHYADKIAYNELRMGYEACANFHGESRCEKKVPDPPLERFVMFLAKFTTDDRI
jgi:hypothetical protein